MRSRPVLNFCAALALAGLLLGCASSKGSSTVSAPSAVPSNAAPTAPLSPSVPLTPPASPTQLANGARSGLPVGLIAVQEYHPGDTSVFTGAVYSNAAITGVALRINWKDLEPSPDHFDWQIVDQTFADAAASQKFVVLILVPGFETPAWALQGVATAKFARQYGPGAGQVGPLPLPWDETYLSKWFSLLQNVADRYGNSPGFRMIAAAGPTSVSAEMSLPNRDSDIVQWKALGYTSVKYVAAWKTVFDAYARIFPKQYVSLALYPGLALGSDGKAEPRQRSETPQSIVTAGLQYKNKFALQTSGLTGSRDANDLYDLVAANAGAIVTGFQLTTSATANPGPMGDASNPAHALALTLERGVAAHVDFLQVYEPDVLNPAMQSVLQTTRTELPH